MLSISTASSLLIGGSVSTSVISTATAPLSYSIQLQYSYNNSTWTNQGSPYTSSSPSYTLASGDVPGQYFRYAITVSSSFGTYFFNTNSVGPTTVSGSTPSVPASVALSGSGVVSWAASTGSPTSYEIEFYTASNSTGSNAAPTGATGYTVTGISSSPYQLISPYGGANANWARVRVRARNGTGASLYSGWVPSATTYT